MAYTKNGCILGVALENVTAQCAGLFPHLIFRNIRCKVNFKRDTRWHDPPGEQGHVKLLEEALYHEVARNPAKQSWVA